MKKSKSKFNYTSRSSIVLFVAIFAVLLIFSSPLGRLIGSTAVTIGMVLSAALAVLAYWARSKRLTIVGLIKSWFPEKEESDDDEDEAEAEAEAPKPSRRRKPTKVEDAPESVWAPVAKDIEAPAGYMALLSEDGKVKILPNPVAGKAYNRKLEVVDIPKTTEEMLRELLERVDRLEHK